MDLTELRGMSDDELLNALEDKKHEMWILRRDRVTGELKNPMAFKYVKRDIARMKTILRERQLAAQLTSGEGNNNG
jgi:large subunit ribosomal protein L29